MKTWKSILFGDNRINFNGWIGTALLVVGVSFWFLLKAIRARADSSPTCLLLEAIYFIVLGHFGITLQSYRARVAKNIEAEDEAKTVK